MEDWKFVGMVLDRFFLWVFTVAVLGGTIGIILRAPSLYDIRFGLALIRTCISGVSDLRYINGIYFIKASNVNFEDSF